MWLSQCEGAVSCEALRWKAVATWCVIAIGIGLDKGELGLDSVKPCSNGLKKLVALACDGELCRAAGLLVKILET